MKRKLLSGFIMLFLVSLLNNCAISNQKIIEADILIKSGLVYSGYNNRPEMFDIAICRDIICFVGKDSSSVTAKKIIDAKGLIVTPGFIDPHTHALPELMSKDKNQNLNYLTQGVTTVIIGNDGGGSSNISLLRKQLSSNGIGTNVGLLVGHGFVRKQVMGLTNAEANLKQIKQMKASVAKAMEEGALGFSSGLYYVPGRYANTSEVIELAKVAAKYGGIYESHLRDEGTFNIGYLEALKELITIAKEAKINGHVAHIKALGVDVWGQSKQAIKLIEQARKNGLKITADQYPWQASGTYLRNAVIPSWVMADSNDSFMERLTNQQLLPKILLETKENIRRRGGADALLITGSDNEAWLGNTLQKIASENFLKPEQMVIDMVLQEKIRVASFNMSQEDIDNFMVQDWVVSSSDGTNRHPRKFASFPNKYKQYVERRKLLTLQSFIYKSSAKTAEIFNIKKRGVIKYSNYADINIIDIKNYQPKANFSNWNKLSTGVVYQFINGKMTMSNGTYSGKLAGSVL
ncbi:MAG: amidohydrolase [Gammaproteobacteria bacterium]|nr:MAG: amidohydrolase [Gammaproteobacteria bacterium]